MGVRAFGVVAPSPEPRQLEALAAALRAFVWAYVADAGVAVMGRSTLWRWKPSEVLVHHFAGIAGPLAVLGYDAVMCARDPDRPRHKTLGAARVFLAVSVITCCNEASTAAFGALRRPSERLQGARRALGAAMVASVFVAEWVTYYSACARKLLARDPSLEAGEFALIQTTWWTAWLHWGFLKGYARSFGLLGGQRK